MNLLSRICRLLRSLRQRGVVKQEIDRGASFGETLLQDARFGARMLRKRPGFTTVAVLVLAFAIGVNTAIFSLLSAVLLKPLPYKNPEQLVSLWEDSTGNGMGRQDVSGGVFLAWKEQSTAFSNLSLIYRQALDLSGRNDPLRLSGAAVSADFLDMLGVKTAVGRGFSSREDQPGRDKVVVIADRLWQTSYGGDKAIIGRTIQLGGEARTIVGVLPPCPMPSPEVEFLIPFDFGHDPWSQAYDDQRFEVIGRLRQGVSVKQAIAQLRTISERIEPGGPQRRKDVAMVPLHEQVTGGQRPVILLLFGCTGFVLLIACCNIAGLLLARASTRQPEFAIRAALGAGRSRLVRQLLAEGFVLAIWGTGSGLLLACWLVQTLPKLNSVLVPGVSQGSIDWRVTGFAIAATVGCGLVFGIAPLAHLLKPGHSDRLRAGRGQYGPPARSVIRRLLVVSQLAIAFILLTGGSLLIRSFLALRSAYLGFDPKGVTVMDVPLPSWKYPDSASRLAFYRELLRKVDSIPGVEAAALVSSLPFTVTSETSFRIVGRPDSETGSAFAEYDFCTRSYFAAMSVPILKGRSFTASDEAGSRPVAIVDETFVKRYLPGGEVLGRQIVAAGLTWEIVGVVGPMRHRRLTPDLRPRIYAPYNLKPEITQCLVVRSNVGPPVVPGIVGRVAAMDPDLPISNVRALADVVWGSLAERRLVLILIAGFGAVALVMALLGLYGSISHFMSDRTHEFGVRVALGATSGGILKLVLRRAAVQIGAALLIGLPTALGLSRLLARFLYETKAADPWTFALVPLVLVSTALFASWLPAQRAARVNPMQALRNE